MKTEILEARVSFTEQPLVTPLILSSGAISTLSEATAEVTVRVDGKEATGAGSIYLSDLWAWPEPSLPHAARDAELRALCHEIAAALPTLCGGEAAHPLELGLHLHAAVAHASPRPPALARAMCASPFDAAIHDAAGQALGRSAFSFYDEPWELPTADGWLGGRACEAIRSLFTPPRQRLRAWYIAGKNDGVAQLRPWVRERGYRCFKIKLMGQDNAVDAARTVEIYRLVRELGATKVELSVDSNEANPDAASVVDYLHRLRTADAEAFQALRYLEQPTHRDIATHRFDWHEVAALKPVMLDEGLTALEQLPGALEQGWSGLALKSCKGQSFTLVAAAWARRHGLLLSLQDLTNPGLAMIHAALLAAHLPTLNDVELNSPQFTPAANAPWADRLPGLFHVTGGEHRLPSQLPPGLGSFMSQR